MFNIDISIGREVYLCNLALIRISPKYGVYEGKICTYKVIIINDKHKQIDLNFKINFPYGDSLKLTNFLLEEIISLCEENDTDLFSYIDNSNKRTKSNMSYIVDISINREQYLQSYILSQVSKTKDTKKLELSIYNYKDSILEPTKEIFNLNNKNYKVDLFKTIKEVNSFLIETNYIFK